MNEKTIAAIALSNHDYPDFQAKLAEASRWIEAAAAQGAQLVVLPEALNLFSGDGSTKRLPLSQVALTDWQRDTRMLFDVAVRCHVAITIPVLIWENDRLVNCFFLISEEGHVIGRYDKRCLTPSERSLDVAPGQTPLIEWQGLKIGGAICFDVYYEHTFADQAAAGADLFLVPSFTPGGDLLNHFALHYGKPIVLAYPAWSRIIERDGKTVAEGGYRWETLRFGHGSPVVIHTINFDAITLFADFNQQKIYDIQSRYGCRVRVRFDQPNCTFTLESRCADLCVKDVMKEFDLISRQDYFAQNDPKIFAASSSNMHRPKP